MYDVVNALKVRIESYERLCVQKCKQAFDDSDAGYHGSAEFNKGQSFALDYVVSDLRDILQRLESVQD